MIYIPYTNPASTRSIKRQSHQAYDQVTTNAFNVRSKIVRFVLKLQKQRTTGREFTIVLVFEHVRRQSHQAYDQITTNVRCKILTIVFKSNETKSTMKLKHNETAHDLS